MFEKGLYVECFEHSTYNPYALQKEKSGLHAAFLNKEHRLSFLLFRKFLI